MSADFLGVILLGLDTLGIANDTLRIKNPQLRSHVRDHSHRDVDRISKKGSQKSERPDLYGEAEPIVVSTALGDELAVLVVQVKIAGKLFRRWFANISAIALFLFLS